jgi:hypothetical protein
MIQWIAKTIIAGLVWLALFSLPFHSEHNLFTYFHQKIIQSPLVQSSWTWARTTTGGLLVQWVGHDSAWVKSLLDGTSKSLKEIEKSTPNSIYPDDILD